MSLAATTSSALTLIDAASLKTNATNTDTKLFPFPAPPIATAWSPDNSTLYVASAHAIHLFNPVSAKITQIFTAPPDAPLAPVLAVRDSSTLVFAQDKTIRLLSTTSRPPKVTASLPAHATSVASLALSSDATLLASASAAAVLHVYNLAHNANTVLRSFPAAARAACVCAFDPHVRTRLFVGAGATLAVYDTARPSSPVKTVALAEKGADVGRVVAISSSPYSKTLVAVACTSFVGLVDLDKDKPLFRSIPVKAPVTSMTFTADGSSVAMGTEHGKVLVQDLRTMERAQRVFDTGKGARVVALSIQKRTKTASTPRITTSHSAPLAPHDTNTAAKSPARRAVSSRTPTTPNARTPVTPNARKVDVAPPKRAFSPSRARVSEDAGDISVQVEALIGGPGARSGSGVKASGATASVASEGGLAPPGVRTRAGSRASDVPVRPDAAGPPRTRTPAPSDTSRTRAPAPTSRRTSAASTLRTATPDLPSVNETDTDSPLWAHALNPARAITTPDIERWAEAGRADRERGGERRVGWADEENGNGSGSDKENVEEGNAVEDEPTVIGKGKAPAPASAPPSMDMSPVRRSHLPAGALQLSPLRTNTAGGNSGAQELLRAVVQDVMYEYRQETREEIKGLHLDLLRVGRSWKSELRGMMQEYVGDLRELREENARLREENERLRRGY